MWFLKGNQMQDKTTSLMNPTLASLNQSVLLVSLPFFILGLLLPVYGKAIGADVVEIGLFFSAFSLMTVLLRPVVGWALDRLGRRPFILAGLGGYALTMLSFAFIDQVWGVIAARIIQGISSSFFWLAVTAMTADLAPSTERGRSFGGITESSSRGSIIGAFVGFTLLNVPFALELGPYRLSSWSLLFIVYGSVSLVAMLMALRRLPETRPAVTTRKQQPLVWSRAWLLLLLVTLVTGASWAMVSPIMIIFLQDKLQVGLDTLSWAFLPSGLVWALLPSRLGRLADRFGRKPLMVLGLVAASASSFLVPYLGGVVALAAVWAFQALCYAAGDPAEQALVSDLTHSDQRGRAYGLYVMCADLGATIGPLGGAYLYQQIGVQAPFFANAALLIVCALVLALFLKEPARPFLGPNGGTE
jgi:MFS family permease